MRKEQTMATGQPDCSYCGGLHYGTPLNQCVFRCKRCGLDIRDDAVGFGHPKCACAPLPVEANSIPLDRKKILCLDFDGVCHSYVSGWKGAAVIPDPPVPGMWSFLERTVYPFDVHIFSSRSNQDGGIDAMKAWFLLHAETEHQRDVCGQLKFPTEKPPAFVGLDDRVLTFDGRWPTIDELRGFKTWNARVV